MPLTVDTWVDRQNALSAEGWTFDSVARYWPTRASGLTPSGKAYTFVAEGPSCTLTIGNRSRSVSRSDWETPTSCEQAWRDCYAAFPANQR